MILWTLFCFPFDSDRGAGKTKLGQRRIGPAEVGEADVVKRPANRDVNALPGTTNSADRFEFAMTVAATAFGYRYRPLECINDVCRADFGGIPCQPVAALGAAERSDQPGLVQGFEQLADRGDSDTGCRGNIGRANEAGRALGQVPENDRAVVGQFADSQHRTAPPMKVDHFSPN